MNFVKLQATGNDFILVDARRLKRDWAGLAKKICDRHFGVGADGLILVTTSKVAQLGMRIFNPDGSEAEVCGNGLRCLAKYAIDRQLVEGATLSVETLAGIKTLRATVLRGKVKRVKVSMGIPSFSVGDIVSNTSSCCEGAFDIISHVDYNLKINGQKLNVSLVSLGNPHAVMFVSEPVADFPLAKIGPRIENHPLFPQRINFEVARILDSRTIEARVWERGVGETFSCGSGACAVGALARYKGLTGSMVDIVLPGGKLTVFWDGVGEMTLTGPVEEVFTGEWLK